MDTGSLKNNSVFYDGYEDEPEIVLSIMNHSEYSIHLWEGYFYDIFENPSLDGKGWTGFTKDIHQLEGAFSLDAPSVAIDASLYLVDLLSYADRSFEYEETKNAFKLIADFLRFAIDHNFSVMMKLT